MSKEGEALAAELEGLWLCGQSYFPSIANASMVPAASKVSSAEASNMEHSRSYPTWVNLRNAFQQALHESVNNMYAAGDALQRVAEHYAAVDGAAATALNNAVADYEQSDRNGTDGENGTPPIWNDKDRPDAKKPETDPTGPVNPPGSDNANPPGPN